MDKQDFIIQQISDELKIKKWQIENVVHLIDGGNTIPFIARYRKEATGELDETALRDTEERLVYLRNLDQRKKEIIKHIDEQGKLTEELKREIESSTLLQRVEDLYRPYKPKRKTRATVAKEKGLEPFALSFLDTSMDKEKLVAAANNYLSDENELTTIEDIFQGAQDIVAEMVSDDSDVRNWVRNETHKKGIFVVQAKDDKAESVYEMYYDYKEPIKSIRHHRVLAINRGEKENFLKVKFELDEQYILQGIRRNFEAFMPFYSLPDYLEDALTDSYKRLIAPSIEREVRQIINEKAEEQAIHIFSANLRQLLLQPPIKDKVILGVDPAFRTGCKLAVIDQLGKVLHISVIYPTPPQNKIEEGNKHLKELVDRYGIDIIVIGNGTASRETESFIADFIQNSEKELEYIIVSEAGASVYSASKIAREEFPKLDVSERSAISIARRLQDPLAELVKIDPKAIGVGQYQHDVSQKKLEDSLSKVVESVVNYVGVDLNTASSSLLQYISGMNKTVAGNIVKYREENGKYQNRKELKKVPRFGEKTFQQAVGFLRIDGDNLLDKTSIHPESYEVTYNLLKHMNMTIEEIGSDQLKQELASISINEISEKLSIGIPTLKDIIESLKRPFRDPRESLPKPIFHKTVLKIEDIKPGMQLTGTVRNIVDFGAFVDIGVKEDGLVHISQISDKYIKHPLDAVSVGDNVDVWVLSTDLNKKRISLTMKQSQV